MNWPHYSKCIGCGRVFRRQAEEWECDRCWRKASTRASLPLPVKDEDDPDPHPSDTQYHGEGYEE